MQAKPEGNEVFKGLKKQTTNQQFYIQCNYPSKLRDIQKYAGLLLDISCSCSFPHSYLTLPSFMSLALILFNVDSISRSCSHCGDSPGMALWLTLRIHWLTGVLLH